MVKLPTPVTYADTKRRYFEIASEIIASDEPQSVWDKHLRAIEQLPSIFIEQLETVLNEALELTNQQSEIIASYGQGFASITEKDNG